MKLVYQYQESGTDGFMSILFLIGSLIGVFASYKLNDSKLNIFTIFFAIILIFSVWAVLTPKNNKTINYQTKEVIGVVSEFKAGKYRDPESFKVDSVFFSYSQFDSFKGFHSPNTYIKRNGDSVRIVYHTEYNRNYILRIEIK